MTDTEKLFTAIKENNLYDYVAIHYYEMSKEQLRDIILELSYVLYTHQIPDKEILEELEYKYRYETE